MQNANDIIGLISTWAYNKRNDIYKLWVATGGWEVWAQNEIKMVFDDYWDCNREWNVYNDASLSADFTLEANGRRRQIVELKVQSVGQDQYQGINSLGTRLRKDVRKTTEKGIHANYRPADIWAIGIACQEEAADAAHNYDYGPFEVNARNVPGTDIYIVWMVHAVY